MVRFRSFLGVFCDFKVKRTTFLSSFITLWIKNKCTFQKYILWWSESPRSASIPLVPRSFTFLKDVWINFNYFQICSAHIRGFIDPRTSNFSISASWKHFNSARSSTFQCVSNTQAWVLIGWWHSIY